MQIKLIYSLYRTLQVAAFPLIVLYVTVRGFRNRIYFQDLQERFGFLPPSFHRTTQDAIWLHAVSVGEVISSVELVRRIRAVLPYSPIFVSYTTVAGREAAQKKLAPLADGLFYVPFDYVFAVRRVLRAIKPSVVCVLETEIWPNLYRETKRSGARLLIVNGRISVRSLPSYRRFRWFFGPVLSLPDRILVQSARDAEHYRLAGASEGRIEQAGNLKYDFNPHVSAVSDPIRHFLDTNKTGPLWIAASTVGPEYPGDVDEDDSVIRAWQELKEEHPDLLLLIAPRRPERFGVVAEKLHAADAPFVRKSELGPTSAARVLLLDSIGELSGLFGEADVVFMGGTLADRGGHNILEPACFGKPIITGPNLQNFSEIQTHFRAGRGLLEISEAGHLRDAVHRLLCDQELASSIGRNASALAEAERGATSRAVNAIRDLRWKSIPHAVPFGPLHPVLRFFSGLWSMGGEWKRAHSEVRRLGTPVVSIGGLAMGGAGKTPFVLHLAGTLVLAGIQPAVLTRGYKRKEKEAATILAAGEQAPVSLTGDEAQILLRRGLTPVGIAADRFAAGQEIERRFRPDLILLDDGFQHAKLHRDVDIVLLDGLDPLGGGEVFPLGRLREPIAALRRADAIVVTRSEHRRYDGLLDLLKAQGVQAPVYYSCVRAKRWMQMDGTPCDLTFLSGMRTLAFCGLANPAAFWVTLERLGVDVVSQRTFPDHHSYRETEIHDILQTAKRTGADVIVTTEKDAMNLPAAVSTPILYLEIGISIDEEDSLMSIVTGTIPARRE